jgi:endonuclease/exonuclease/phosphatase family metal-dependent hydrolase
LVRHPADFIHVQEANDFQADFILKVMADFRATGRSENAPPAWQDNVIFFHESWKLLDSDRFFLSPTPEIESRFPDSRWPRQCVFGRFEKNGRVLVCANTHFDFSESVQVKSALLVLDRLSIFAPAGPAVLSGDFNARPDSACYRTFTESADPGFPPFSDAFDNGFPGTCHRFSGIPDPQVGRIDWVLFRGGLCPKERKVLSKPLAGRYPSDHFPLLAVFSLEE